MCRSWLGACVAKALASTITLHGLELHNAPDLGPDGVAHLTALQQLTRLELSGIGYRRRIQRQFAAKMANSEVCLKTARSASVEGVVCNE